MPRKPRANFFRHLVTLGCTLAATLATAVAEDAKPRVKPYRVIFNCDGHAVAKDAQGDLDQWLENLFAPLQNSQVDALFSCDGAGLTVPSPLFALPANET